ncbi:MAG: DUF262 domain-containing protein [Deltaproteobacteria bacterium]|nr:DUF262 domain-containing protein [Deltaproteobacteria bacterium]MBW1834312.1 DUF262 domain-containing protein [Deltaproteobacteria bacterium]MBW2166109.1 DUF262 domain-containing protein [Deltaproteobacteria bacterium]
MFDDERIKQAMEQLEIEKKIVDYDTKEYPVEVLVQKYNDNIDDEENELFIPDYQRDFVWNLKRRSKFIESVLLGLPVPYVFVADNEGRMEIVDGSQRIRTLVSFCIDELILCDLIKLSKLNGFKYSDLPVKERRRFNRKTIRMIELTDKADENIRRDIFERINTGSDELSEMEKRKGIMTGKFYSFLNECSQNQLFKKLCPISIKKKIREEETELVLRFFAYSENYLNFNHSVADFLSEYMTKMNVQETYTAEKEKFEKMLNYAERLLSHGFTRTPNAKTTPRVRFETLSVGINLALQTNNDLTIPNNLEWLDSDDFARHTRSDASNSRPKVKARVEYVRDKLLGGD